MILSRLAALYDRLLASGEVETPGFERRPIAFLLVLDAGGRLLDIVDTRAGEGAAKRGRILRVPQAVKRSVNVSANLLWDNAEYVLGLSRDTASSDAARVKVAARHAAFRARIDDLPAVVLQDPAIVAVRAFLAGLDPNDFAAGVQASRLDDPTANISFALRTPEHPVCEAPILAAAVAGEINTDALQCLVTGRFEPPARLHPSLRLAGGQPSGVSLVSFNLSAFESYGLTQGANAPVGVSAASAYGTALNWLLASPHHRLRLGQLTVVSWSDQRASQETFFADLFGDAPKDEPEPDRIARATRIEELFASPRTGTTPSAPDTHFYVLGLSPNAARAAVALWDQRSLPDALRRVRRWFIELDLTGRPPFLPERLSLPTLLRALAPLGEMDRLPPRLPASLISAAISGGRLPGEILPLALGRLRIPRTAAAPFALTSLLRLVLARNHAMELPVSLDPHSTDPAYRWGRLFAVYELVQGDAQPGINATIRDRFWSAAAATPSVVFGTLSRLNGHHLRRLDDPKRRRAERVVGEIMAGVAASGFPGRLSLPEQGRFAVGYWHQRADWFTRREPARAVPTEAIDA